MARKKTPTEAGDELEKVGEALEQVGEALEESLRSSIQAASDVAFAYLFGSAVKGSMRADSDVDVAVHLAEDGDAGASGPDGFGDRRPADERVEIAERIQRLEATLQSTLTRPVQVVSLELAPNGLVHNVLRHGRLLVCRDDRLRARFWEAHARRHFDLLNARRIFDRYRGRRIQEGTFGGRSGDRT